MRAFKFRASMMETVERCLDDLLSERNNDEGNPTQSSRDQDEVEGNVLRLFDSAEKLSEVDPEAPVLLRQKHVSFLTKCLTHLPPSYECLDSSRPWLVYWALHSLALLNEKLEPDVYSKIACFLGKCQSPLGGFGGGPGQFPHLACTYAAVNALCSIGTEEAFKVINREKLAEFLWSVRQSDGSFQMHKGGEVDLRGVYCALSISKLTNVFTPELFEGSAEWIVRCQSYEGGFSACPGMEAHGGYAFCGLAALFILGKDHLCDITAFVRWITNRQMRLEGGFQGRTNKLVDACYSFWQGGAFMLLHHILIRDYSSAVNSERWLFDQESLQHYILTCCQSSHGGLIDKPGKPRDVYHTCYALSGLSLAQHSFLVDGYIVGSQRNKLAPIHPIYNICLELAVKASHYFEALPVPRTV